MLNPPDSTSQSKNRNGGGVDFDLLDEIAVEILSWLPAKDVARLRSVSKRWRDLTCSQQFTLLHMHRCLPMVLFDEHADGDKENWYSDHWLLDRWWEPATPKSYNFGIFSELSILFSHGGLVVMKHSNFGYHKIINPMYHESIHIKLSSEMRDSDIYGVFFHPSLKEYCTLWGITVSGRIVSGGVETERDEYRILTLGSKPCWREVRNPWVHKTRSCHVPPILIGDHLYWAVKTEPDSKSSFPADIMEFDIRKEEFTFIPSPVLGSVECHKLHLNILDIGGCLSWVWISPNEASQSEKSVNVNIWTLKDRARQLWTKSTYRLSTDACYLPSVPIASVNDEIIFHTYGDPFICNLKLCTARKFEDDRKEDRNIPFSLATHVMSLLSLRNCKAEIYMDKRGEVRREAVGYVGWS